MLGYDGVRTRSEADVPGPRGDRLAGNLLPYERDRLAWLLASRAYGPVVRFDRTTTVVHGPDLVREILMNRSGGFAIRHNLLQERIPDDELGDWVDARRLLNPHLRLRAVVASAPVVAQVTHEALRATGGRPVEAMPLLERISSEVAATQLFGPDHRDLPQQADALLEALTAVIGNPFALPAWVPARSRRRIRSAMAGASATVRELLEERLRRPGPDDDLASAMLRSRPEAHWRDEVLERVSRALVGALLAGHRVPAAAMGWLHHRLLEHPDLAAELQPEAATLAALLRSDLPVTPNAFPTSARFIAETLRLHPPTWLLSRTVLSPQQVGGFELPRGHTVLVSPYVVHRDPDAFEDPEVFRPDRWRHAGAAPPAAYLPYGVGPRACPGRDLASLTLMVVLLTSVHGFATTGSTSGVVPDPRTTLLPRGLDLAFLPRGG